MSKKTITIALIAAVIITIIIAAVTGPFRLQKARKAANEFADGTGISIQYEGRETINSKEELLTEIWELALWEEKTIDALNTAFEYTEEEYNSPDTESRSGYEKDEVLLNYARKKKWRELRLFLSVNVDKTIESLFGKSKMGYGLDEETVKDCHWNGEFGTIIQVMQAVENGAGMEAYNLACKKLDKDWSALPMDIAYGLRPNLIMAGAKAAVLSAIKTNELSDIRKAVGYAQLFEDRYNVRVEGLDNAKRKKEQLEYAAKPDIPAVGMSVSKARSTKLGSPTRTTQESGSWMHKKHTYGDMVWERGDKQIFRAHYKDGKITEVYDTRNTTGKSPWRRSTGSSSKSSFDPDDHDIEAYYEDHRDEYDDYDDAYDGFLDHEADWDDY